MRWHPETNNRSPWKVGQDCVKMTFPRLRPLESAVSYRGGYTKCVFISTYFCITRDRGIRQGLRDKNKNLYEKVQMCETWKAGKALDMEIGHLTKQCLPLPGLKNPWFFSKWHCCGSSSFPRIPITDMPQMRALLKIASNEFEMRFLVLGSWWCTGSWNYQIWGGDFVEFPISSLGWRRMMTPVGLEGRAAI